jgi:hypothetical protein
MVLKKLQVLQQRYQGKVVLEGYRLGIYRYQGSFIIQMVTIRQGLIVFGLSHMLLQYKRDGGWWVLQNLGVSSPEKFLAAYFHSLDAYFHLQDFRVTVGKWSYRFSPNGVISTYAHF